MRVGIDLISSARFLIKSTAFINSNFSEGEIAYINSEKKNKPQTMAGLFAAKEAFLKALGVGIYGGIAIKDIEIVHNEKGKPQLKLDEKVLKLHNIKDIDISIAHDAGFTTAICIIN